ncbi:MAG TPA: hypothetical protein ENN33_03825 [Ignavibacteria bacterium]|nr:hypothetical protein [Ignavibacteria bacterium]
MLRKFLLSLIPILFFSSIIISQEATKIGDFTYDDFEKPEYCGTSCHTDFYQQWKQAMMSQAYTHHWDEIEYFKLAVPHAERDEKVAEVKEGCNGCHTPIAYISGDNPPPFPSENSRANESVSCDVCHTITGFAGDVPYNFNYIMSPGKTKYSSRKGDIDSPAHQIVRSEFHKTTEFCGICHNEKSPYDIWVKSTQLEWKEGPYAEENVRCQDCHMTKAETKSATMGITYPDTKLHLFHGAHDPGKIKGTIEVRIHPDIREVEPGDVVKLTVALFNQKTGHKFPTGSVEDRIVWLHVEAKDSEGNVYHLPVDKKGFEGEEYTIAADVLAYQDMGVPLDMPDFKGVQRDAIPLGNRIFRMPYFDPQGRMTIQQWNTASLGVDYRFGPRETKIETFTFNVPYEISEGKVTVTATINYQKLVTSVGEFLEVPDEEMEIIKVGEHSTEFTVFY